ncbi:MULTISPECIES: LiaF transmembrane domain-containing protein [Lactobacillaceae]|uniref:LiaF transmembrane domain-containing protein n=1 Tax=Lactobacillaceae TaxID=33958 RepID=UPI000C1B7B4A|nr:MULTISPECIES: hypothetical protein [Lactobacillaceae]
MRQRWFWGVFFVLGAAILAASQMNLITYNIGFWSILASVFLVAAFVQSLVHMQVTGAVFSLAFLAMIFSKPLGISSLVPWTVIGIAVLLSIGLSLIFRPLIIREHQRRYVNYYKKKIMSYGQNFGNSDVKTVDNPDVNVQVRMSQGIRYIESDDFRSANITVSMGDAKVYFENVTVEDEASIYVDCSLGNVDLFIPREWNINNRINNTLSGLSESGRPVKGDGPKVNIEGNLYLSGMKITYI